MGIFAAIKFITNPKKAAQRQWANSYLPYFDLPVTLRIRTGCYRLTPEPERSYHNNKGHDNTGPNLQRPPASFFLISTKHKKQIPR